MGYWKAKVLPKLKKVFDTNGKKAAAAEACKSFDDSKEEISKAFEAKRTDLQPQVIQVYEASSDEIKALIKEPKEAGLKKHSASVTKFLEELVKIEFPGSKPVSEVSSKFGPAYVSGPVFFVFEKVSTFIVTTEEKEVVEDTTTAKETDVLVEEKKEEIVVAEVEEIVVAEVEKTETSLEEAPPAEAEKKAEETAEAAPKA